MPESPVTVRFAAFNVLPRINIVVTANHRLRRAPDTNRASFRLSFNDYKQIVKFEPVLGVSFNDKPIPLKDRFFA